MHDWLLAFFFLVASIIAVAGLTAALFKGFIKGFGVLISVWTRIEPPLHKWVNNFSRWWQSTIVPTAAFRLWVRIWTVVSWAVSLSLVAFIIWFFVQLLSSILPARF